MVESGTVDVTYTSDVAAGLIPIDNISAYETGDLDNDSRDEIVVKAHVNLQGGLGSGSWPLLIGTHPLELHFLLGSLHAALEAISYLPM